MRLYLHAAVIIPVRPVEELKDFARVSLTADKLESYDLSMRRTVAPGEFEVLVGKSSADALKGILRID